MFFNEGLLLGKINQIRNIIKKCVLCPRECGIDRTKGERGFCGLTDNMIMSSVLPHYGEEPPISGQFGAGAVFFSSCNLRCIFCQNYQISHGGLGKAVSAKELSEKMITLQQKKCHNIEVVTATPHLLGFMNAFRMAARAGLNVPIVYNCGGYEKPETIKILSGVVSVYLPDFKYGDESDSYAFSGVKNYTAYAVLSIKEMVRQVGDAIDIVDGTARKGIIIRHLVLPGKLNNSIKVLKAIKKYISKTIPISIMSQYTPIQSVKNHPLLGRTVTKQEYEDVVNAALDLGYEYLFVQDVNDCNMVPHFEQEEPFKRG